MRLKDSSVQIQGIRPEMMFAIIVADQEYTKLGHELVITSINDGAHSLTSLHYSGCAIDMRTSMLTIKEAQHVTLKIKEKLGLDYDVLYETNHIHLEFQPRKR